MNGVRVRDGALEGKCEACLEWWPLAEDWRDYWYPRRGLARCIACQRLFQAGNLRRLRETKPEVAEAHRAYMRDYYAANSTWINGKRMTREEAALKRLTEPDKAEARRRYNRLYQRRRRALAKAS